MTRFIADLQFWRRFTVASPQCSFKFLLGLMPFNPNELFSDACTSYGMAGILRFGPSRRREHDVDGLFWQYSWVEWTKIVCMLRLMPGAIQINVAEFLAALITYETFVPYCWATCTEPSCSAVSYGPSYGPVGAFCQAEYTRSVNSARLR